MVETILLVAPRGCSARELRGAVARVDPGPGAELLVRGEARGQERPWVVHRGRTALGACGNLGRDLKAEILASLRAADSNE